MGEVYKIVLTGGPCAGKSTALTYLKTELEKQGVTALTHEETATELMREGITPQGAGSYAFHAELFARQLAAEDALLAQAEMLNGKVAVLLDRGLLDNRAYVTEEDFVRYASAHDFTEEKIRNRYDAVFHFVTAANGAQAHYSNESNAVRSEDLAQARALDEDILSLWVGVNHLRILDNSTDFEGKLHRLLREVDATLGIPEPLEIERKFLIAYPDIERLNSMKLCRRVPIEQAYLETPQEGRFRVRRRGDREEALYIKTVKHKINDMKRVEIETLISQDEYRRYLSMSEYVSGVIAKDRYCIAWNGRYYELDVYPFWADRATLEIELLSEDEPFELPDFCSVIREVTPEKKYRNKTLAAVYKNLFING